MHDIFQVQNCRGLFHNVPNILATQQEIFVAQGFFKPRFNDHFRVLASYIYKLGAVTEIDDHAEETKENTTGSPLSSTSLSVNVWGNVVIHQFKTSRMSEGSETHSRICNIVINSHD